MKLKAFLILFLAISVCYAQVPVTGKWKTVDDSQGDVRSIIEISESGGKLYGKIIKLFPRPAEDPDPVCNLCSQEDDRHNKKVIGMEIIRGLKKDGKEYSGGDILDPENGKVYRSRIWIDGKDLKVRGYWGPFYRTQTWRRAD